MATIVKRGRSWQAKVRRKGWPGYTATFDRKADAEAWAGEIESQMRKGIYHDASDAQETNLADLFRRYRETVSPKKRGGEVEAYRLAAWERSHPLREYAIANIRSYQIAEWRDRRLESVTAETVIRELTLFTHVFEHATREWNIYIPVNPASAKLVARPKRPSPDGRDRRLRSDEEDRLLMAAEPGGERGPRVKWLRSLIILALETGMRRGELLQLRWEAIDFQSRVATLPGAKTKTETGRSVPLSSRALDALYSLHPKRSGPVIPGTADAVKQAWERCRERARRTYHRDCEATSTPIDPEMFDDLRFHDLRHEATSRLFEKRLTIMEVASITGHKDPRMLRRYTHYNAALLAQKLL